MSHTRKILKAHIDLHSFSYNHNHNIKSRGGFRGPLNVIYLGMCIFRGNHNDLASKMLAMTLSYLNSEYHGCAQFLNG